MSLFDLFFSVKSEPLDDNTVGRLVDQHMTKIMHIEKSDEVCIRLDTMPPFPYGIIARIASEHFAAIVYYNGTQNACRVITYDATLTKYTIITYPKRIAKQLVDGHADSITFADFLPKVVKSAKQFCIC